MEQNNNWLRSAGICLVVIAMMLLAGFSVFNAENDLPFAGSIVNASLSEQSEGENALAGTTDDYGEVVAVSGSNAGESMQNDHNIVLKTVQAAAQKATEPDLTAAVTIEVEAPVLVNTQQALGAEPLPEDNGYGGSKELPFEVEAEAAILMEASTGKNLYDKNAYERYEPASVTKIMTLLLALEAINAGEIRWDENLVVSNKAGRMKGSQMGLEAGQEVSIKNILKGISTVSANDGSIAIAEHLYGTERNFVQKMNEKASELGMASSNFQNSSGWPAENHYTSARDIAILSAFAINVQTGILDLTSQREFTFNGVHRHSYNPLLGNYEGADGLKTGWTGRAGYCLAGTVEKDGLRLIAVVLNSPTDSARGADTEALMNYGFSEFSFDTVANKGDIVSQAAVSNRKDTEVDLVVAENLGALVPANLGYDLKTEIKIGKVSAPITKGDVQGRIFVTNTKGEVLNQTDLLAAADVELKKIRFIGN